MNFNKKISILGCGWLGFELAKDLISCGFEVLGSSTTTSKITALSEVGISPFLLDLSDADHQPNCSFFSSDVLIINIPPGRHKSDSFPFYHQKIKKALFIAKKCETQNVILISSSGIFNPNRSKGPNFVFPIYKDSDVPNSTSDSAKQLIRAEAILRDIFENRGTVLRFGGLVGGERKAGRFLSGKRNLENADAPVNLIHRKDCIEIIKQIIFQDAWGLTFNAVTDHHPTRKIFYTDQSLKQGFDPPHFKFSEESEGKIINNQYLKKLLSYSFIHPDPMKF